MTYKEQHGGEKAQYFISKVRVIFFLGLHYLTVTDFGFIEQRVSCPDVITDDIVTRTSLAS